VADSSVLLEVIVEGKNIKIVQREIEELGASINKATNAEEKNTKEKKKNKKATNDSTKAGDRYSKGQKGVAGATNNSTKAFSKMRNAIGGQGGGLVAAYATLAANVFAISAAFGVLQRAAAVEQLEKGITSLGQSSGIAMRSLSNGLKEATGNAIALEEAMRSTAMVIGAGFDSSTLERLGEVARSASIALGRDTADSLARLTRGAVKLEPELLDELGIMVRLDEATNDYAEKIGKSATALTSFERRQAFMNAVLEEGEKKYKAINDSVETNPYDQLAAAFADLTKEITRFLNESAGIATVVKVLTSNMYLLAGALLTIGKGALTAAIAAFAPVLTTLSSRFVTSAADAAKLASNKARVTAAALKGTPTMKKYAESLASGTQNTKQFNKAIVNGTRGLKNRYTNLKKHIAANGLFNSTTKEKVVSLFSATRAVNSLSIAQFKGRLATIAYREQFIFAQLEAGNFGKALGKLFLQFGRINTAAKSAAAGATLTGKAFLFLEKSAKKAGLGLRFLGASFLAVLPYIGIIILAIGALKAAVEFLYRKFYETKSLKEFSSELQKTKELVEETTEIFKKLGDIENFSDRTVAEANAMRGGIDSINKTLDAYIALDVPPLSDKLFKGLDTTDFTMILGPIGWLVSAIGALADIEIPSLADALNFAGFKSSAQETVEQVENLINSNERYRKAFEEKYEGQSLSSLVFGEDGTFDPAKLKEIQNSVTGVATKTVESMATVAKATKAASEAFDELLAKSVVSTDYDNVVSSADDIAKSFGSLSLEGLERGGLPALDELVKGLSIAEQKFYGIKDIVDGRFNGTRFEGLDENYIKTVDVEAYKQALIDAAKARALELKTARDEVSLGPAREATAKNLLSLEKARTIYSGQYKAVAEAQNSLADAQINTLEQQLFLDRSRLESMTKEQKLSLAGLSLKEKILQTESQIDVLTQGKVDTEEQAVEAAKENLSILQLQQNAQKALLDVQQKMLAAQESMISSRKTLLEIEMKAANRRDPRRGGDATLTASQEYQISKKLEEDRKKAAVDQYKIKVQQIMMEYDLLELQFKLQKAEADNINAKARLATGRDVIDTSFLDRAIAGLGDSERAALEAAGLDFLAKYRGVIDSTADALDKAIQESITASGSYLQKAQAAADPGGFADPNSDATTREKLAGTLNFVSPLVEDLKKLGPEGEYIAAVVEGANTMIDSFLMVGETFKAVFDSMDGISYDSAQCLSLRIGVSMDFESKAEIAAAAFSAAASTIGAISSILSAQSRQAVAGIDKEIEAEKKRDGKSKESLAKIKQLEAKKEQMKRKAFETDKKLKLAQAVMSTAAGIAAALTLPPPLSFIMAGLTAALGAAQIAVISGMSYQGGGQKPDAGGPSQISIGERKSTVDLAKSQSATGEQAYLRGERGIGGPEAFTPAFMGAKYRAMGGATTGYVVGEQGPELFVPDRPGTVVPADQTAQVNSAPTNVNFTINAVDAAGVDEVISRQRGTIIGVIREAANSYGDLFLEDVDTNVYTSSYDSQRIYRGDQ
jgi:hypothetical protein